MDTVWITNPEVGPGSTRFFFAGFAIRLVASLITVDEAPDLGDGRGNGSMCPLKGVCPTRSMTDL